MVIYRNPTKKEFKRALKEVGSTEAGSGDSPFTQEYLDNCWGKKKETNKQS